MFAAGSIWAYRVMPSFSPSKERTVPTTSPEGYIPPSPEVVICHSEGYRRGIASGHADVEHWFPKHGKSMDDFRTDVAAELASGPEPEPEEDDMTYYKTLDEVPEDYRPTVEKLMEAGALKGTGPNVLNVSEDFCRIMTVLDRLGKLEP